MLSESNFNELAKQGYNRIPLMCEILADLDTPLSTYTKISHSSYSYLFESVEGGEKWGRYSIIGLPAKRIVSITGKKITIMENNKCVDARVALGAVAPTALLVEDASKALIGSNFEEEAVESGRSSLIFPSDISSLRCHYLALGHWDVYTDVSQGAIPAFYSGAPAGIYADKFSSIIVDLDPANGVTHSLRKFD